MPRHAYYNLAAWKRIRALSLPNGYTRDVIIRSAAHMDRLERENNELKEKIASGTTDKVQA